ncbi:MAG: hypothetical protein JWM44_4176 [Bacilli bacterium]|nr:hypothetical protein [Bacilli bacterium]
MKNKGKLIALGIVLSLFLIFAGPFIFKVLEFSGNAKEYLSYKYPGVKMNSGWALPDLLGLGYHSKVKVPNPQGDFVFYVNLDSDGNVTSDDYLRWALASDIKHKFSNLLKAFIPDVTVNIQSFTPPNEREYFQTHDSTDITYSSELGGIDGIYVSWKEESPLNPNNFANKSITAAKILLAKYKVSAFYFWCHITDKEEVRLEFYNNEMNQPIEQLVSKIKTYKSE